MYRYHVTYTTHFGRYGHAVIEQKTPMTEAEIINRVNQDLIRDWVSEAEIGQMSRGASLASKILIKAANLFLK